MPLNITKVAYKAESLEEIQGWFSGDAKEKRIRTRYQPKRHEEMIGGSVYWVFQGALIGRSPILGFERRDSDGHWDVILKNQLILVHPQAKRGHQGWRYLTERTAPKDLAEGEVAGDAMPGVLVRKLSKLGLV